MLVRGGRVQGPPGRALPHHPRHARRRRRRATASRAARKYGAKAAGSKGSAQAMPRPSQASPRKDRTYAGPAGRHPLDAAGNKFINKLMRGGKKSTRRAHRLQAPSPHRERRPGATRVDVFERRMRNATPVSRSSPRASAAPTYQVPVEIRRGRRIALGMRWLIDAARKRDGKRWPRSSRASSWTPPNGIGAAVKRARTPTGWPRRTRPSATSQW